MDPGHLASQKPAHEDDCLKKKKKKKTIPNKSENATPELFAIYIQNFANQE